MEYRQLLVVDDPITGPLLWLAWGLLPYVVDPVPSAIVAPALSLLALAGWRGERPKALEASDALTFSVVLVMSLVAGLGHGPVGGSL